MTEKDSELIRAVKPEKKTLLERYDIPVEHLSYEYISECTNGKTLERILLILRSGEEGTYPDLIRHAEERLKVVKPLSIVLRKAEPVRTRIMLDSNERNEIDTDINNWMTEMHAREKDLEDGRTSLTSEPLVQPDIRQIKEKSVKNDINQGRKSMKAKRIPSCDYAAWDKYDVDTEINKIDIQDEVKQTEIKRFQQKQKVAREKQKTTKDVILNKSLFTVTELNIMSEQEREKGNEAFRAGDYQVALKHYNCSIKLNSSVTTYNNRAMTFIKLQCYEDAINDCNMVLSEQYTNVKALLRRASALESQEKSSQALEDYETVLKLEPTNKTAIAGVKKLRKPCVSRKVRMTIEEKDDNSSEDLIANTTGEDDRNNGDFHSMISDMNQICFCDRAPGPSQNVKPRPHLKMNYCLESKKEERLLNKINISHDAKVPSEKAISESSTLQLQKDLIHPPNKHDSTKAVNTMCKVQKHVPVAAKPKSIFSYTNKPDNSIPTLEHFSKESSSGNLKNVYENNINASNDSDTNLNEKASKKGRVRKKVQGSTDNVKISNKNEGDSTDCDENSDVKIPLCLKKIEAADKYQSEANKSENDISKRLNCINSPYEFTCIWQSLTNDKDLKTHAQLLRSLSPHNINASNKLDGTMFHTILCCLEQHFCRTEDIELLMGFLKAFSEINRFPIMKMFMDSDDKRALKNIFNFLEEQKTSEVVPLREVYCA